MNFRVLEDGVILDKNGLKIGTIQVESDKYRDDIIQVLTSKYDMSILDDIRDLYMPDTNSSDYDIIREKMDEMGIEKVKYNYEEIVSLINYYN